MHDALTDLENKVAQTIALCERLSQDNQRLRARLNACQEENTALNEKIEAASSRLQTLLNQWPEAS